MILEGSFSFPMLCRELFRNLGLFQHIFRSSIAREKNLEYVETVKNIDKARENWSFLTKILSCKLSSNER